MRVAGPGVNALDYRVALGRVVLDQRDQAGEGDLVTLFESLEQGFQTRTHGRGVIAANTGSLSRLVLHNEEP